MQNKSDSDTYDIHRQAWLVERRVENGSYVPMPGLVMLALATQLEASATAVEKGEYALAAALTTAAAQLLTAMTASQSKVDWVSSN